MREPYVLPITLQQGAVPNVMQIPLMSTGSMPLRGPSPIRYYKNIDEGTLFLENIGIDPRI